MLYQKIPTRGATSLAAFNSAANATYLVIANSRDNAGNIEQDVVIYGWHDLTRQFRAVQRISALNVHRVDSFTAAVSHALDQSARSNVFTISCFSGYVGVGIRLCDVFDCFV